MTNLWISLKAQQASCLVIRKLIQIIKGASGIGGGHMSREDSSEPIIISGAGCIPPFLRIAKLDEMLIADAHVCEGKAQPLFGKALLPGVWNSPNICYGLHPDGYKRRDEALDIRALITNCIDGLTHSAPPHC